MVYEVLLKRSAGVLYVVDDARRRVEVIAVGHRRDVYR